jgi:hypothetical protein
VARSRRRRDDSQDPQFCSGRVGPGRKMLRIGWRVGEGGREPYGGGRTGWEEQNMGGSMAWEARCLNWMLPRCRAEILFLALARVFPVGSGWRWTVRGCWRKDQGRGITGDLWRIHNSTQARKDGSLFSSGGWASASHVARSRVTVCVGKVEYTIEQRGRYATCYSTAATRTKVNATIYRS